nr:ATP synthase subunit 4 [Georgeantha hexandra]
MKDRKMLFAAISSICASSPKKIAIYNEEMIVAGCFIGFLIFCRKSLGKTFQEIIDGRIESIQEELQQFSHPHEVIPPESNEQQGFLRMSLRICSTVVESLPTARCAPKCEKTVQALLCRNLNVKSATLLNATSSRRIRLQDDLVTAFHFSVSERFAPRSEIIEASMVDPIRESFLRIDLIREGLVVLRKVRAGGTSTEAGPLRTSRRSFSSVASPGEEEKQPHTDSTPAPAASQETNTVKCIDDNADNTSTKEKLKEGMKAKDHPQDIIPSTDEKKMQNSPVPYSYISFLKKRREAWYRMDSEMDQGEGLGVLALMLGSLCYGIYWLSLFFWKLCLKEWYYRILAWDLWNQFGEVWHFISNFFGGG